MFLGLIRLPLPLHTHIRSASYIYNVFQQCLLWLVAIRMQPHALILIGFTHHTVVGESLGFSLAMCCRLWLGKPTHFLLLIGVLLYIDILAPASVASGHMADATQTWYMCHILCKPKTGSAKFNCICRYNNCINFVLYKLIDTFYFELYILLYQFCLLVYSVQLNNNCVLHYIVITIYVVLIDTFYFKLYIILYQFCLFVYSGLLNNNCVLHYIVITIYVVLIDTFYFKLYILLYQFCLLVYSVQLNNNFVIHYIVFYYICCMFWSKLLICF
jgi:hypothetical protein